MNERRPPSPTNAPEEDDLLMTVKEVVKENRDLVKKLREFLDQEDDLPEANFW
jgi:hypothetical protein